MTYRSKEPLAFSNSLAVSLFFVPSEMMLILREGYDPVRIRSGIGCRSVVL